MRGGNRRGIAGKDPPLVIFSGGKDNVSRRQYKISLLIFIVKEMPIF